MKNKKPDTRGMKILIVDDTKTNLDVLRKTLEPRGYDISIAQNGDMALKIASRFRPDLILLDIMMPGMDGFETCHQLKKNDPDHHTPVIFISAKNEAEDIVKCFSVGGIDYIAKPFHQEEVIARVETHLNLVLVLRKNDDLIKELEHSTKTDYLTGLSNRKDIEEKIKIEMKRFDRSQKGFSIIMSDIDYFKQINDNYGHDGGDYVLRHLGTLLRESLRDQDVVARWGGEEFLFFIPDNTVEESMVVGEKLRAMVEKEEFLFSNNRIAVTMSFGIATYSNREVSLMDLVKQADECLYRAKKEGRNKVVHAEK